MIQNDIPDETITILHCVSTLFTKSSPLFSVSSLANYTSPRLGPTGDVISYSSFTEVALTLETVPIRSYPTAEELSLASTWLPVVFTFRPLLSSPLRLRYLQLYQCFL